MEKVQKLDENVPAGAHHELHTFSYNLSKTTGHF